MLPFEVCGGCRCHIRVDEGICPFCGASQARRVRRVPRAIARMSRAQWAAFGSTLVLMSCNDSPKAPVAIDAPSGDAMAIDVASDVGTTPMVDAGRVGDGRLENDVTDAPRDARDVDRTDGKVDPGDVDRDARLDAVADAGVDADDNDARNDADDAPTDALADSGADAFDARIDVSSDAGLDGAFFPCCNPFNSSDPRLCPHCDRRTELCDNTTTPSPHDFPCTTFDGGALGSFPQQCMPEPSCACIAPFYSWCHWPSSSFGCSEDAGAVFVSCNGCYGAPPARLERKYA